ncbi:MAG: hypothetical protein COA84_09035 [Robiginitomaculum sp.]|nr:MAG: hypothetical protein COA84_09035 [Robiginitomaculum sp.]
MAGLILQAVVYSMGIGAVLIIGAQASFVFNIDNNEGLVEWMQFAILLGGAITLALRKEPKGRWLRHIVVAGLFVLAMEEIDWAQPYLGYTPLPILADNNAYGEMALHNAFGLEKYLRKAVLIALMLGAGSLLTLVTLRKGMEGLIRYGKDTVLWPGALFSGGVIALVAGRLMHPGEYFSFDEFGELSIYAGVIMFTLSMPLEVLARTTR